MRGMLEKVKKIMDLADEQPFDGFATFIQVDDGEGEWLTQLHMEAEDWEDMGKPTVLTVTIKPGDLLNGDVASWEGTLDES